VARRSINRHRNPKNPQAFTLISASFFCVIPLQLLVCVRVIVRFGDPR
jgi:hypothetical protein